MFSIAEIERRLNEERIEVSRTQFNGNSSCLWIYKIKIFQRFKRYTT